MYMLRQLAAKIYLLILLVGSFGLIGLMLVVGGTVVYRWFGGTFQGSYEVAETFTIVTITSAIFLATANRTHVDVRLVYQGFPRAMRRWTMTGVGLVSLIFWALVSYSVYRLALRLSVRGEITDVLRIDIVPFRWLIVTGFVGVTLVLAYQTWRWLLGDDPDADGGHDPVDSFAGTEDRHGS